MTTKKYGLTKQKTDMTQLEIFFVFSSNCMQSIKNKSNLETSLKDLIMHPEKLCIILF